MEYRRFLKNLIVSNSDEEKLTSATSALLQLGFIVAILLMIGKYNYLLFQGMTGLFGAAVWIVIFSTAWGARRYIDNNYFLIIGTASLFVGVIDVLQIFTTENNNIFAGRAEGIEASLWLASAFLLALSLVLATLFDRQKIRPLFWFFSYLIGSFALIFAIISQRIIPTIYSDEFGFSAFGLFGEYLTIGLFAVAIGLLIFKRKNFDKRMQQLVVLAISCSLAAELFFRLRLHEASFADFIYHILKISAAYVLYLGVVETGLMRPYRVLFRNLKDREISLSESEERYRTLIEHSPNAIFLHVDGRIIYTNSVAVELFEAESVKDLLDKNIFDFLPANYKDKVESRIRTVSEGVKLSPVQEVRIKTLNGRFIDVETTGNLVSIKGEKVIQTVMTDITKRKQYERQAKHYTEKIEQYANDLRKFKLAVENASDAIYITNENFEVVYANYTTEHVTGYYSKELIGQTTAKWRDLTDETKITRQLTMPGRGQLISGPIAEEVVNIRKNGMKYVAQLEVSPVHDDDGDTVFYVFIERDVTRQKEIDLAKSEFVSLASHQLRTPLAGITLSADLLERGVYGEMTDKQTEAVKEIMNSCARMKALISELLNVSRIELGTLQINYATFSLAEQLEQILVEHELIIANKKISLTTKYAADLPPITFDKNVLRIVMDNLLSNAVRYTEMGGKIMVSFVRHNDDAIISVKDTGCGIPLESQVRIFDKLFRADNAQAISAEGSGLGLYMAKAALKRVGGSIWVESIKDEGSTFFVRLPIRNN
jgi:PAS domain S-box-containing protein